MVDSILIDRRNISTILKQVVAEISSTQFVGIDVETHDDDRHEGLNQLMKINPDTRKKAGNTRLIFDTRRTTMTGFSVYPENAHCAYYINLAHKDVENRVTFDEVRPIIDALPEGGYWLSHNSPYEITMFENCHKVSLERIICTLQLSVTAFGDDNYNHLEFQTAGLGGLAKWPMALFSAAVSGKPAVFDADEEEEDDGSNRRFNRAVDDIIGKICSKTSTAVHSYNGFVKDLAYGHGLKQLVRAFFGHEMSNFKDTLGENAHMGQMTGDEVARYGAEDAYWVVPLFRKLMEHVAINSPNALSTFFSQENPMTQVYSELWRGGMRVDGKAIEARRTEERKTFARHLRDLRKCLAAFQFDELPNAELAKRETWYDKNHAKYRKLITDWINTPDTDDDYAEARRVSNAVSNAWAEEKGDRGKAPLSITHYMPARVMLYDLLMAKLQFDMGKLISDGDARGKIKTWFEKQDMTEQVKAVDTIGQMASVEQRMKLYLTPYSLLMDPETGCLYPTVNSLLNSRRMAASTPNPMQLAKRGESTYVRGFFLGDNDEHMVVSLDWSAIELVIIGELSGDPEFFKAFGQRPHEDLHTGAAVSVLGVEMPWLTEAQFKSLKKIHNLNDWRETHGIREEDCKRLFTNLKGEPIKDGPGVNKLWRTEIGKGANFNYWYSGFLHTIGQAMGWGMETTGNATELYRQRFAVAEEWRVDLIQQCQLHGWVELPDGHRRERYEATQEWMEYFKAKWPADEELRPIVHEIARRISKRAQNQAVNSVVQGTCATIMKRSILRMREEIKRRGWDARFMIPIHDEKVYSVHHALVPEFIEVCRNVMIDHKDLFPTLLLEATPAVGVTFEPWHPTKAPLGQVELFEPPKDIVGEAREGLPLDSDGIREVVEYLRMGKMRMAA